MGSIAVMEADTIEELDILYNKIKKKIFDSYLKYESSENVDNCVIIQEKIHGQEYGLDVFNNLEGKYITTIAKRKIAMRSGETDIAEIVNPAPFETIGSLLANKLSHIANLDVDCFVADNGDIYVLELNCRFGGQYPFSHNAGVNFPKQIVSFLKGLGVEKNLITPQIGVVSCKEIYPVIFKS
jgi:carbamoyl-phosphate synthase large subunit